ncbi:SMP-30/gluconolactonase/LRE family protein [Massilia forsythiae]|uniref:SMP-30/gluconolactonase/LRE family protein n=1 Tax=Massilia forsythiae TaxID=2728020 RepID=A0A7Z2ZWU2_9BURK|nr:SMP-30/gluconolactonase/LRE family protein [Massilia forsythiae]
MDFVGDVRCSVGESPLWCARQAAWYWVDIAAMTIWRLDAASGRLASWQTTEKVASIALTESGGLIAGMESGIFSLELGSSGMAAQRKLGAPPGGMGPGMRFNDGRCDRQGRFWSGTMFADIAANRPLGNLHRYTVRDGVSAPVVSGLLVQNGLAWSPDGRTMYLSDSHPQRQLVWAFDYDPDDGVPSGQRLFVDMQTLPGRPDGAAVDSDGCYWICGNDGGCVLRFTPDGKLDRRVDVPMLKPSMCSFGGAGLDTLLVTSIAVGKTEGDVWAGAIVMLRPGVIGVAETPFPA